ncbi:MAG: hypothetical protein AABZ74_09470 [Cyanobacteriota bacterium]
MKFSKTAMYIVTVLSLAGCSNSLTDLSNVSGKQVGSNLVNSSDVTLTNAGFNTNALSAELVAKYPDLQKELDAAKALPVDQRNAKLTELKAKYPELATLKGGRGGNKGKGGPGGHEGFGGKGGFGGAVQAFATTNTQFKADLDALRATGKTNMDALIAKYPDLVAKIATEKKAHLDQIRAINPALATELEALQAQNLTPEQMKVKMDEFRTKYPMTGKVKDANFDKGGHEGNRGKGGPIGHEGFGGPGGHGGGAVQAFATTNTQFKADLDALRASEKTNMDALIAKYPDLVAKIAAEKKAHLDQIRAINPALATELEALQAQNLTPEQMKVKMDELRVKYPMAHNKK